MPTINQLIKKPRTKKFRSNKRLALNKCPQKRGIIMKLILRAPRKPNSAIRKLALVRLSNRKRIYGYICGDRHNLQEHSAVLIRGGRVKDLPGIKYKLVRGVYDFVGLLHRRNARSKYGTKNLLKL